MNSPTHTRGAGALSQALVSTRPEHVIFGNTPAAVCIIPSLADLLILSWMPGYYQTTSLIAREWLLCVSPSLDIGTPPGLIIGGCENGILRSIPAGLLKGEAYNGHPTAGNRLERISP